MYSLTFNFQVRREDCPEEKKNKLTRELHALVKGNIKVINMKRAATQHPSFDYFSVTLILLYFYQTFTILVIILIEEGFHCHFYRLDIVNNNISERTWRL